LENPLNRSIREDVAAIATRLCEGGPGALSSLYDRSAPRLLRYAETLTKNRADAEDALQSGLVRIARKPRLLARADQPWAYLVRVVRNEALKILKKRRTGSSLSQMLEHWRPQECPLEEAEDRELVRQAVAKLPQEQAEVVVLKIWEGFTFAEIAETIDESPNTAASRYRYALEKLTRSLQPLAQPVESPLADIPQIDFSLAPQQSPAREVDHV
jgi:RNA polymerase sigma-70 factor (ECF subfamily)